MYAEGLFPKQSDKACKLKWSWSTIWLYQGYTASCHRCTKDKITPDNLLNFHNTPNKIKQRTDMLNNQWPGNGCEHCRDIEELGGVSDRLTQNNIPNYPIELESDANTLSVTPTTVEVFFDNTCNLSCIYCCARNSSKIYNENKKYGEIPVITKEQALPEKDLNYLENKRLFWEWMKINSINIERFNILGGEPFMQDDFDDCLHFFNEYPNPQLTLTAVSNLIIRPSKFKQYINKLKDLVDNKKLKSIDITASIDGWGAEEEFVRYGLDISLFEQNMEYLINQSDWLNVNINQTLTSLTIKSVPDLIDKINLWRNKKDIGHYVQKVIDREHLNPIHFGIDFWEDSFQKILKRLKQNTFNEKQAYNLFLGEYKRLQSVSNINYEQLKNLFFYLDEIDKRRKTNWRDIFPYIAELEKDVV